MIKRNRKQKSGVIMWNWRDFLIFFGDFQYDKPVADPIAQQDVLDLVINNQVALHVKPRVKTVKTGIPLDRQDWQKARKII